VAVSNRELRALECECAHTHDLPPYSPSCKAPFDLALAREDTRRLLLINNSSAGNFVPASAAVLNSPATTTTEWPDEYRQGCLTSTIILK
jgi:hypothetical protein